MNYEQVNDCNQNMRLCARCQVISRVRQRNVSPVYFASFRRLNPRVRRKIISSGFFYLNDRRPENTFRNKHPWFTESFRFVRKSDIIRVYLSAKEQDYLRRNKGGKKKLGSSRFSFLFLNWLSKECQVKLSTQCIRAAGPARGRWVFPPLPFPFESSQAAYTARGSTVHRGHRGSYSARHLTFHG